MEDELPTPDDSPGSVAVGSAGAVEPEVRLTPRGDFYMELAKALLDVSVVPMITPIVDPVDSMVSPAEYMEPPLPVVLVDIPVLVAEYSPLREVADGPHRECSPSFQASPVGSGYGPIPSPMSTSSRIADGHGPPPHMATMDQYLPRMDTPFGGESSDSPLLPRPLTPQPLVEVMVVESILDCVNAEPVAVSPPSMPDLSRESPFDVHQVTLESGASPRVLDSLPGCQNKMTSYDVENDRSDFSPAYGIHLHDPRLLEYVGAPEWARLLSRNTGCIIWNMKRLWRQCCS